MENIKTFEEFDKEQSNEEKEKYKIYLEDYANEKLEATKLRYNYICPYCQSGKGQHGTSAFFINKNDPVYFTCFSCGNHGDIYKLVKEIEGIENFSDQLKFVKNKYEGVVPQSTPRKLSKATRENSNIQDRELSTEELETIKTAITESQKTMQNPKENIKALEYIANRGISLKTAKEYGLGYIQNWQTYQASQDPEKKDKFSPRLIIPTGVNSYVARAIEDWRKPKAIKQGNSNFFNIESIKEKSINIIVEGEFDALSILELFNTYGVVSLGGINNIDKLVRTIKSMDLKYKDNTLFLLALDNDDPGKRATLEALKKFNDNGLKVGVIEYSSLHKDINEFLMKSRDTLRKTIDEEVKKAINNPLTPEKIKEMTQGENEGENTEPQQDTQETEINEEDYRLQNAMDTVTEYICNLMESKKNKAIKTGYEYFDEELNGLYPGLYGIGAISSLGKTTYLIQMSYQLAAAGYDVLFFSLEMSKLELVSKAISRLTHKYSKQLFNSEWYAKTVRGIKFYNDNDNVQLYIEKLQENGTIDKKKASKIDNEEFKRNSNKVLAAALNEYQKAAERFFIFEEKPSSSQEDGKIKKIERIGVQEIWDIVNRHIKITGKKPIVFIDYLQILKSSDVRMTDKQMTDDHVIKLKMMSREFDIPVFFVSALNRASYGRGNISMEAFKESGAIEYTTDVLLGLQFRNAGDKDYNVDVEKAKKVRSIEMKVLKNRNGKTGISLYYDFIAKYNLFIEEPF